MPYRYAIEKVDYTDYSSGRVFYGKPGYPALSIRAVSEIFQASLSHLENSQPIKPYTLFDPVCGGAYHLSTLAFFHWESIKSIICSDIDIDILNTAAKNLGLLSLIGMDKRIEELKILVKTYGKESHTSALNSAYRLRQRLITLTSHHNIQTSVFQADATAKNAFTEKLGKIKVDIVIADIPYGIHSSWLRSDNSLQNPIESMLENLRLVLSSEAVVAVAADKRSRITHPSYERIERFNIGKRRITILSQQASS